MTKAGKKVSKKADKKGRSFVVKDDDVEDDKVDAKMDEDDDLELDEDDMDIVLGPIINESTRSHRPTRNLKPNYNIRRYFSGEED